MILTVCTQYTSMTDRLTDGQTDALSRQLVSRLHIASRSENNSDTRDNKLINLWFSLYLRLPITVKVI